MGQARKELPRQFAARYRVVRDIGRGGMAAVYEVHDQQCDRRLALKQLIAGGKPSTQVRAARLFEQEYHTLTQLTHPRVIEVYDYVKEGGDAFYTMELLDGGDIRELSPLPWHRACQLMIDVCSGLSLLHSRRLVHRDVTPRNVRCTQDGQAKLIDFGAMTPFGRCKHIVGTPPYTAPEALSGQALDGRADLFAVGATAYYALTGRHAFPAQTFEAVRNAWRTPPAPPSRIQEDIPQDLDDLVLSLLRISSLARPANAAEVMERLSAIGGFDLDEQLVVRQAYLSTPNLVGRSDALQSVRQRVTSAVAGDGGPLLVTGPDGVGRSRFLDACVLEGKLAGAIVLHADATDNGRGPGSVVAALAEQLVAALGDRALTAARPHASVLCKAIPQLAELLEDYRETGVQRKLDTPQALRAAAQEALREWLFDVAESRCLMIAVDDLHLIDELSSASLALLGHASRNKRVLVVATAPVKSAGHAKHAAALMSRAGDALTLRNLSLDDTGLLLTSVFGEVPNVKLLASRLHASSNGTPRTVMQLAQHLLDREVVRYHAGSWTLPDSIDAGDLPRSLDDALRQRVARVEERACRTAQTIALSSTQSLSFDDLLRLELHDNAAALSRDLDSLVAHEILSTNGEQYSLAQPSLRRALVHGLTSRNKTKLHQRLANAFKAAGNQRFRVVHHLILARRMDAALELFLSVGAAEELLRVDPLVTHERLRTLPDTWRETYSALLRWSEKRKRPVRDQLHLRSFLVSCSTVLGHSPREQMIALIERLTYDSGLDLFQEQDPTLDAGTRLQQALQQAQKRYDETPEHERGFPLLEAIPRLAQGVVQAIGCSGRAYDYEMYDVLPSLEPLVPLSPALALIEINRKGSRDILAGRTDRARAQMYDLLERMEQPDGGGLDKVHQEYMRLAVTFAVGALEVQMGLPEAVKHADSIAHNPAFSVNACRLRLLHALRQGDWEATERHRERLELLRIQDSPPQMFEGSHLWGEVLAYAAVGDLGRIKQILPSVESMSLQARSWKPCLLGTRGVYHLLRGDGDSALMALDAAAKLIEPGRHIAWGAIAGWQLQALIQLGRHEEAERRAQDRMRQVEAHGLEALAYHIEAPHALVLALLGRHDEAERVADRMIAHFQQIGSRGIGLGTAYEQRAKIAAIAKQREDFERYASMCASEYRTGRNPALTAKYERLMHFARGAELVVPSELARAADLTRAEDTENLARLVTMLASCSGPEERAQQGLRQLITQSRCCAGYLYVIRRSGPELAACSDSDEPSAELANWVREYIAAEVSDNDEVTATAEFDWASNRPPDWRSKGGARLVPMLLAHNGPAGYVVTGLAALQPSAEGTYSTPEHVLRALSQALLESGDAVTARADG